MARQRVLITDFSRGQVSKKMMGRLDLGVQQNTAELIEGFVIAPDGGITRRRGTVRIHAGLGITPDPDGLFAENSAPAVQVVRRGESDSAVPWLVFVEPASPYRVRAVNLQTGAEQTTAATAAVASGRPLHATQTYYTEPDGLPENQQVKLWTPDGSVRVGLHSWTVIDDTVRDIGAVFQNRLIALDREWGTIWSSVPLELDRFELTEDIPIPGTDPVEYETVSTGAFMVVPDFYGAEFPRWILAYNGLFFGTDHAEYALTSGFPYLSHEPGGANVQKMSEIGSDGAIAFGGTFVLRTRDRLVQTAFNGGGQTMTTYLDNGTWVEHVAVEYGGHRYVLALDMHGDLYCYTLSDVVSGWTRVMTGVWWVASYDEDVFVVRVDDGEFVVDVLPLDSLTVPANRSPYEDELFRAANRYADHGGFVRVTESSVTGDDLAPSSSVDVYRLSAGELSFLGSRGTTSTGELSGTVADIKAFVGYAGSDVWLFCVPPSEYTSMVTTMPLNIASALGTAIGELKRVYNVTIIVHQSTALEARVNDGAWQPWSSDVPYTGPVSLGVSSPSAEVVQVSVRSVGDQPLTIMSIEADVQVSET